MASLSNKPATITSNKPSIKIKAIAIIIVLIIIAGVIYSTSQRQAERPEMTVPEKNPDSKR